MRFPLFCSLLAVTIVAAARPAAPPFFLRDQDGDALPAGAVARLGSTRLAQLGVHGLALAPDGKAVATVDGVGTLFLWDLATGRRRWSAETPRWFGGTPVWSRFHFSADGRHLALAGGSYDDRNARVFEVATGQRLRRLALPFNPAVVRFSPDGKRLAVGGYNGSVLVWKWEGDDEPLTWPGLPVVTGLAWRRDGKTLVGFGDEYKPSQATPVVVWGTADGKVVSRHGAQAGILALSPDGRFFAGRTGDGKRVGLFDPATGKLLLRTDIDAPFAGHLAVSADGRVLAAADVNGETRICDATTGRLLHRTPPAPAEIRYAALSPDGKRLALGGWYGPTVYLWDLSGRAPRRLLADLPGHRHGPLRVAFAADGKSVLTASNDPVQTSPVPRIWQRWSFRRWDPATGKERASIERDPGGEVRFNVFSHDARLLAVVTHDATVQLWDTRSGKELRRWRGPTKTTTRPAVAGRKAESWTQSLMNEPVFSPDASVLLATDQAGILHRWDVATGKPLPPFWPWSKELGKTPPGVTFARCLPSADGRTLLLLAYAAGPGGKAATRLVLLDARTGAIRRDFTVDGYQPTAGISPDGKTLAVANGAERGSVRLIEAATGRERGALSGGPNFLNLLVYSPDGRLLAGGGLNDTAVRLWRLDTRQVRRLAGHRLQVGSLAFSPDGKRLVSGAGENTALVWDVAEAFAPVRR